VQRIGYADLGGHWWNTPLIGGCFRTTNVPPYSFSFAAGALQEWCSIHQMKFTQIHSIHLFGVHRFGLFKSAKVEIQQKRFKPWERLHG
jgi:hypothetical protein